MRIFLIFVMVVLMSRATFSQGKTSAPAATPGATATQQNVQAVTDPQQIVSRSKADVQKFALDKLFMSYAIGGTAWSPDGRSIAFISNISGRRNLWLVATSGGSPVQITASDQRQGSPAWSPDGKWIAFISDHDGNEQWDVFLVNSAGGEITNLTRTPVIAETDPAWSPDGKSLAYLVKPKTAPNWEIDVMDISTRQVQHVTQGTPHHLSVANFVWSSDGAQVAYTLENANGKDSNIMIADLATGKSKNMTNHKGELHFVVNDWSPDGNSLLITSDAANGYQNIGLMDIATQQISWLTMDKWESTGGNFSYNGKLLTWTTNVDGNTDVLLYNIENRSTQTLPLKKGTNTLGGAESAFSRDNSKLLLYHNGPDSPSDVWVYDVATAQSHAVTHSLASGVHGEDMVEPYLVHYPSTDGKWQISAFVYVPYNLQRKPENPAIIYIHGGPASQTVNAFDRAVQYLVNQGYIVVAPNYRGSTGYGKDFQEANFNDMGGGDLQDNLAAADWIKKTGYVDPKKLIIMGGSYGGYMTMMGVTKIPDLWAAGVAIVPFVNWFTEIENEDPLLREIDLATMGDPVKEKARYEERSPIFFVDKIKAPLLLLAGGNDPRCPKSEAQQVADAIHKRGGVAELKIYEDEGHGFARRENQIDAYTRVANFLKQHLPPLNADPKH
ncbi:MAG TPA: S9 family peptidase [Terriglobales bacterium]|nr:S9 family peptidase [Terriglobales bacterium]